MRIVPGVLAALAAGLTACSLFQPQSPPLIQEEAKSRSGTDVFAVGAERRVIISQRRDVDRLFCSEPPPDVAQSFADSVRASLQLAAQQQASANQSSSRNVQVPAPANGASAPPSGAQSSAASQQSGGSESASGNANLSLARDFATSISQIYTRSQGVQLFRDGSFMLCQAHLNRALRGDELAEILRIATEMERTQFLQDNPGKQVPSRLEPSVQSIGMATKALADAAGKETELNYSRKFTELLNTVHSVLIQELPNLYRYDVEMAKKQAAQAVERAASAVTVASAHAAAASAAQTGAGQFRDLAAQSAAQAAAASASAASHSVDAKRSADAAAAAASAVATPKAAPTPSTPASAAPTARRPAAKPPAAAASEQARPAPPRAASSAPSPGR